MGAGAGSGRRRGRVSASRPESAQRWAPASARALARRSGSTVGSAGGLARSVRPWARRVGSALGSALGSADGSALGGVLPPGSSVGSAASVAAGVISVATSRKTWSPTRSRTRVVDRWPVEPDMGASRDARRIRDGRPAGGSRESTKPPQDGGGVEVRSGRSAGTKRDRSKMSATALGPRFASPGHWAGRLIRLPPPTGRREERQPYYPLPPNSSPIWPTRPHHTAGSGAVTTTGPVAHRSDAPYSKPC